MAKLTLGHAIWMGAALLVMSCHERERKIDTYENVRKSLKSVEQEQTDPIADPSGFEAEVNNGGLNQYFFNASGENCFATLRYFKQTGKLEEAKILEEAISLINPKKLPEKELIEKLRKRNVDELDDSVVNKKLDKLDAEFYQLK